MYYFLFALNGLLMVFFPVLLATMIARRRRVDWGLFGVGAATFVVAQLFHIPFNALITRSGLLPAATTSVQNTAVVAIFLGLSAGFFEEVSRYLAYRYWAKDARSWHRGLMMGAGHGGIEAILLGLLFLLNFFLLGGARMGFFADLFSASTLPAINTQVAQMFAVPWFATLLGAVERLFALSMHLALSLMVMQVFTRGRIIWLPLALLWHALIDALAVFGMIRWGAYATEGVVGLLALISVGIIFGLRRDATSEIVESSQHEPHRPLPRVEVELTSERLEDTRYNG